MPLEESEKADLSGMKSKYPEKEKLSWKIASADLREDQDYSDAE